MNTRRTFIQSTGIAVALAAAPFTRAFAQKDDIIKLGGSIPMSGAQSDTGLNVLEGYKVAVKYLNDELGGVEVGDRKYKLELEMFDDASDPQRATNLIQKQIDQGVDFFLGSFSSSIVLPTAAITERAHKPMVQAGGGSDQIFTRGFKYVFGMFPRASQQLVPLAVLLEKLKPDVQSCSLITTNDAYSLTQAKGAIDALEARGLTIKKLYKLPKSANDALGVLSDVRANTPDALICNTHEQVSALIAQQMVSTQTDVKFLYMALGPEVPGFRTNLGKYADGLAFLQYWDPRMTYQDPFFGSAANYMKYYNAVAKRPEAYQTVAASACIVTYVKAMQAAKKLDPQLVRDALSATDFECMYGRIKFTPQGDGDPLLMAPGVGQVENGKSEIVFPERIATAKLQFPHRPWAQF